MHVLFLALYWIGRESFERPFKEVVVDRFSIKGFDDSHVC